MKKLEGESRTVQVKEQDGGTHEFTYVPYHCDNTDCPEFLDIKCHDMKTGKPRAYRTINAFNQADIEEYVVVEEEE